MAKKVAQIAEDYAVDETPGGVSMSSARLSAIFAAAVFTECRPRWA